ncbi:MAG TPA: hypothetical protein VGR03_07170 [Candidatus Acidoferrum sp.]|nr:hypothetical protein [Candidatus Acidoferrum sp.]
MDAISQKVQWILIVLGFVGARYTCPDLVGIVPLLAVCHPGRSEGIVATLVESLIDAQ